jgi:N utilization substance protein B
MKPDQTPENKKSAPKKPNRRHRARACALQAIYQWEFTEDSPEHIAQHFIIDHSEELGDITNMDLDYFRVLVVGTLRNIDAIDAQMTPFLDRPLSQLNPVELAALRLAIQELTAHPDVPHPVVLNEAIELAKEFGAVDGYKFVNGVLNAFVRAQKKQSHFCFYLKYYIY